MIGNGKAYEPNFQVTLEAAPRATDSAGISVTAKPVLSEIFGFYGLIGLTALILVLVLLNVANRSTVPYIKRNIPPADETKGDPNS